MSWPGASVMESPDRFQNCDRVRYVSVPAESFPLPVPTRTEGESLGIGVSTDGTGTGPMSPGEDRSSPPIVIKRLFAGGATPWKTATSDPSKAHNSQYQLIPGRPVGSV